ncbi:Cyanovirin-N [Kalaharituber pfeilii]|nr:Cyanovirin-N [Kalaharituber pfeilii]
MSFHESSNNISIEVSDSSTYLIATANDANGDAVPNKIRLDDFIGNDNGRFDWGGENFTETAQNITFSVEAGVPVLRAQLADVDGNLHSADVNLAERIENKDGQLVFA